MAKIVKEDDVIRARINHEVKEEAMKAARRGEVKKVASVKA